MTLSSSMRAARFEEVNEPLHLEEMPVPECFYLQEI